MMEPGGVNKAVPVRTATLYPDLEASMQALAEHDIRVEESRRVVEQALLSGRPLYGINTGFGALADQKITDDQLVQLQHNLLLSHACGVGEPVPHAICRLMLQLKIHALGLGQSGISLRTFRQLLAFDRHGLVPWVPSRGSVGASGDLAPLAHLALPLLGRGACWDEAGEKKISSAERLAQLGLEPIELQAKDGLALINGTQLMSAYGAFVLQRAHVLAREADILAGMSLEALQGSAVPFDARIQGVRPHPGQERVARNIRALLKDSEIMESHRDCGKVQDPYCLRCVPQVHGASRDALEYAAGVLETEMNSVTDNPLVFQDGDILSGGNFHGQPLALALDFAALALAELGSISERRTYLLLEGHDGLPRLLMRDTGVNSGFMIPQYTAAALVSENKVLSHPASVDSIPTSLGQEDHVSMGSISALKLLGIMKNLQRILAVELLTVSQALDFRAPLRPGRGVETAHQTLRARVDHAPEDYEVKTDLDQCEQMLASGGLADSVESAIGRLA
jgi:histidine ammonia-lyase